MPKSPTAYHRPHTLAAAQELLAKPDTLPLGGGTKLLATDVAGAVVDLQDLALNQLAWPPDQLLVGAMVRLTDLAAALAEKAGDAHPGALLSQAIAQAGPNTYRHAATLGGTIGARLPDSELLSALLVLGTQITLQTPAPQTLSLADYLAAPERPSGLITDIHIPWTTGHGTSARVARTPADYPIVSITLWQPEAGSPALAATGLSARPRLLTDAAAHVQAGMGEEAVAGAAQAAAAACEHPGDFRGDAAYRAEMAAVLTRRVCGSAA